MNATRSKSAPKKSAKRAAVKTTETAASVDAFLETVPEPMRTDAALLCRWLREWTGEAPAMWGTAIVGFGRCRYRYESGREGDWMVLGFSPRKKNLTLYLLDGLEAHAAELAALGPHSTGASCVYLSRLAEVNALALRAIVERSFAATLARFSA